MFLFIYVSFSLFLCIYLSQFLGACPTVYLFISFSIKMWLRYWKKYSDSSNGCKVKEALVKVVRRYLTSPPTSTNVERLFSYAGMVMEDRRALMLPERVNRILFLRENLVMMNFKLDWWNFSQWFISLWGHFISFTSSSNSNKINVS